MRRTYYDKLVRDRTADDLRSKQLAFGAHILTPEHLVQARVAKTAEEIREFLFYTVQGSHLEIEEAGDCLTVLRYQLRLKEERFLSLVDEVYERAYPNLGTMDHEDVRSSRDLEEDRLRQELLMFEDTEDARERYVRSGNLLQGVLRTYKTGRFPLFQLLGRRKEKNDFYGEFDRGVFLEYVDEPES